MFFRVTRALLKCMRKGNLTVARGSFSNLRQLASSFICINKWFVIFPGEESRKEKNHSLLSKGSIWGSKQQGTIGGVVLLHYKNTWVFLTATNGMNWEPSLSAHTHFLVKANVFISVPRGTHLCFQNQLVCSLHSAKNKRKPCVYSWLPDYLLY